MKTNKKKKQEEKKQVEINIDTDGIKVFSLKKDTVNNKPYRIVMDVQKQGVAPKSNYYGSKKTTAKSSSSPTKKTSSTSTGAATTISSNGNYKTSGGLAGKVITLDPGHGGSDPGAIGPNGLQEKQVTYRTLGCICSLYKKNS